MGCAAVIALTAASAAIGASSPIVDHPELFVTLRTVTCVGNVALIGVVLSRRLSPRMVVVLLAATALMACAGLTGADSPVPFAVGRIAATLAVVAVIYVCFSYPAGAIEDRPALIVFAVTTAVLIALLAANVLLSDVPPVAGPFVRCSGSDCPKNPFTLVMVSHAAGTRLSAALGLATATALFTVAAVVARRAVIATSLQRRSVTPLLVWAVFAALGYAFYVGVRTVNAHAPLLTPAAVIVVSIIATMPMAIGLGLVRGRVFVIAALEELVAQLSEESSLADMQHTLRRTFADPAMQLLVREPLTERYLDVDGRIVDLDSIDQPRRATSVRHGHADAILVHDSILSADVVDAAGSAVRLALENARLQSDLSTSIRQLEASRRRVAGAADEERRRIEQDLHDGAQQGLIALRIKLQLLEDLAAADPRSLGPALAEAGRRVDRTLEHIRDVAHGIYPAVLRDLGLAYALSALARDMPIEVGVQTNLHRRLAPDCETAVYFCCAEALQNVAKHCGPGARAQLRLRDDPGGLEFAISDTGPGFVPSEIATTHGISGMRDRIEAVGGRLRIESATGRGTTVAGSVPASSL